MVLPKKGSSFAWVNLKNILSGHIHNRGLNVVDLVGLTRNPLEIISAEGYHGFFILQSKINTKGKKIEYI